VNTEVLAVGELLIDMISADFADSFDHAQQYQRLAGGSPANLGSNLARLGRKVGLVATVGQDGMGEYLARFVADLGLDTQGLRRVAQPTTLILVTRSREVSDFEAYRMADREIQFHQFPAKWDGVRLFHTTCFALSQDPARTSILMAARLAAQAGVQLSIDANYAAKIWPNQSEAQAVVAAYCSGGAMVKVSEVDWERLYGAPWASTEAAIAHFHQLGARLVCLTMGAEGCVVSDGDTVFRLGTRPVEVVDTTGAGDAFWSGFLCAWLDGYSLAECALAARRMAEYKLTHFGPLPTKVERQKIYEDLR
jgi:sugar/nucleoside kinase (ribokinase family)